MSARDPRQTYLNRRRPTRRTPVWVAATGFALVLCALAVMARTTPPTPSASPAVSAVASHTAAQQVVARPIVESLPVPQAVRDNQAPTPAPAREQLTAGGSGADYQSLIDLIQNETSGPWEDVDGSGGTISDTGEMAGIHIDPNGLLTRLAVTDRTGELEELSTLAAGGTDNADLRRRSRLRLVSLSRLEQEVARRLESGENIPADIRHLAGLQQIRFVFTYPETGDIVIGGPAEGFKVNKTTGDAIGATSGHPVLQLDDLVTVLRAFTAEGGGVIGCSIDPRPEGLKKINDFVTRSNQKGALAPGAVKNWTRELGNALGRQDITITGVPADSRVARILVEADYKMKLIGIGQLDAGQDVPGIFSLMTAQERKDSSLDALRWWLSMKVAQVRHSAAGDAFQLVDSTVLCRSENEFVNQQGQRVATGQTDGSNQAFARNFTDHYSDLSRKDRVFAELRNIFDLALVAALVGRQGLAEQAGWQMGVFAHHGDFRPATHPVPRTVDSVVNHRVFNGRDVVVQVAGGVRADVGSLLASRDALKANPKLNGVAPAARPTDLADGRWWWDVKVPDQTAGLSR